MTPFGRVPRAGPEPPRSHAQAKAGCEIALLVHGVHSDSTCWNRLGVGLSRTWLYELLVRLHVIPGLGKPRLRALQAQHIRTWLSGLRTTCQCCAQGKDAERAMRGKAPATVMATAVVCRLHNDGKRL